MRTLISGRATFPRNSWSGTILRRNDIKGLCLILDRDLLRGEPGQVMLSALAAGVRFFQYRSKNEPRKDIYHASLQLAGIARGAGALFIVNDHADIAAATGADGVHLGQGDLPIAEARKVLGEGKIVGLSTHSRGQALAAETAGADYIGFGPIFATSTKDAGVAQGVERIRDIKQAVRVPVIAIGGINRDTIRAVMSAGADGVAVISAVLSAPDPSRAAAELIGLIT